MHSPIRKPCMLFEISSSASIAGARALQEIILKYNAILCKYSSILKLDLFLVRLPVVDQENITAQCYFLKVEGVIICVFLDVYVLLKWMGQVRGDKFGVLETTFSTFPIADH